MRHLGLCGAHSGPLWIASSHPGLGIERDRILTDPFHNVGIYWKSPLELLRGQRFDPIEPEHRHAEV